MESGFDQAMSAAAPRPARRPRNSSPGRATWNCQTVYGLIAAAYSVNSTVLDLPSGLRVDWPLEGPSWIASAPYEIIAEAEGIPARDLMADRFKLKIHREARDTSVYALAVSRNGAQLQPFKEGS